jgi:hypothetical protein
MNTPGLPSLTIARQELEESWRLKYQEAHDRYRAASARYRKLLDAKPEGLMPEKNGALAFARQEESEALSEYSRVLKTFTDITVHGFVPETDRAGTKHEAEG